MDNARPHEAKSVSDFLARWGLRSVLILPTARSLTVGLFPVSEDEATNAWKVVSRSKGNYEFSTYKFKKTFEKWAIARVRAVAARMAKMH